MREFTSLRNYKHFEQSVKEKARFVHDEQVQEFLQTVLETSKSRSGELPKGQLLFRAQRGFSWRPQSFEDHEDIEVQGAHPRSRMIPTAEHARDGRVSPSGIPVLYLASSSKAAMAEVRPWVGSYVSLAQFKLMRGCTVVDCSSDKQRDLLTIVWGSDPPNAAEIEAGIWGDIAHAFSKPVAIDEARIEYVATQVLAEAFRSHGYEGIVYRSLLDKEGKNVALFDVSAAAPVAYALHRARSVDFEFDLVDGPSVDAKHHFEATKNRSSDGDPCGPEESTKED